MPRITEPALVLFASLSVARFARADIAPEPPVPGGSVTIGIGLLLAAAAVAAIVFLRRRG